jgi:hypothetical protein
LGLFLFYQEQGGSMRTPWLMQTILGFSLSGEFICPQNRRELILNILRRRMARRVIYRDVASNFIPDEIIWNNFIRHILMAHLQSDHAPHDFRY